MTMMPMVVMLAMLMMPIAMSVIDWLLPMVMPRTRMIYCDDGDDDNYGYGDW